MNGGWDYTYSFGSDDANVTRVEFWFPGTFLASFLASDGEPRWFGKWCDVEMQGKNKE